MFRKKSEFSVGMADPAATNKKHKTINSIKTLSSHRVFIEFIVALCMLRFSPATLVLPVMNWHLVQGVFCLCWEVSWAPDTCNPDTDYLLQKIDGWILYKIPKMGLDLIQN